MLKSEEIRRQAAQRLRELFPTAEAWDEGRDVKIGNQRVDLLVRFRLGAQEHTLVLEVCSLGQPRLIRSSVMRLQELRKHLAHAYPLATAVYIGPQSARILKSNHLGYLDLSGNCYLNLGTVLIEKEGKRNVRPSTRPLRSLFAPRASRVVRVLLTESARAWRLEELARAAEVSLGHAHNVVKRLAELSWAERDDTQRIRLAKPADLLEHWCESYGYRQNDIMSFVVPARPNRQFMAEVARAATQERQRCAFSLNAGLSLVAPFLRLPAIHCYVDGDPGRIAAALGARPATEGDGVLHVMVPYDPGVFHGMIEKGGLKVVCLPQLYADLMHYERRGPEQAGHLRREAMGY